MMSACRGEVDEALVLLIEANTQQAQQAGATQVVEVLTKLTKRIQEEKERKLPEEQVCYTIISVAAVIVIACVLLLVGIAPAASTAAAQLVGGEEDFAVRGFQADQDGRCGRTHSGRLG